MASFLEVTNGRLNYLINIGSIATIRPSQEGKGSVVAIDGKDIIITTIHSYEDMKKALKKALITKDENVVFLCDRPDPDSPVVTLHDV